MKRRAFTLVELLVVIAIIALLLGVLMPALNKAKEMAKAVLCGGNIRQFNLGLSMYEQTHGTFPNYDQTWGRIHTGTPPGGWAHGGHTQAFWFQLAAIELGKGPAWRKLMKCPSNRLKYEQAKVSAGSWITIGNYAANVNICKKEVLVGATTETAGKALGMMDIPHPSQTMLVTDGGTISAWWKRTAKWVAQKYIYNHIYTPGMEANRFPPNWMGPDNVGLDHWVYQDAWNGRHMFRQLNVGFVDGHVRRMHADDVAVDGPDNPHFGDTSEYFNYVPFWRPKW